MSLLVVVRQNEGVAMIFRQGCQGGPDFLVLDEVGNGDFIVGERLESDAIGERIAATARALLGDRGVSDADGEEGAEAPTGRRICSRRAPETRQGILEA